MRTRATIGALALAAGLTAALPLAAAQADPKTEPFDLVCGGNAYSIVTSDGHGEFTPAFDTASNTMFVPVSFGAFTGTITGPGGFSDTFTDEATAVKGSGKQHDLTTCTYSFSETFTLTAQEAAEQDLPGAGTYTFNGSGSVTGQIKGR